jgi:hypothetical protein
MTIGTHTLSQQLSLPEAQEGAADDRGKGRAARANGPESASRKHLLLMECILCIALMRLNQGTPDAGIAVLRGEGCLVQAQVCATL